MGARAVRGRGTPAEGSRADRADARTRRAAGAAGHTECRGQAEQQRQLLGERRAEQDDPKAEDGLALRRHTAST